MDGESRSPLFYRHVAAGAVSAVVASALTYPLDVAKTVAQAGVAQASVAHAVVAQTGAVQGSTIAGGPGGGSSGGLARSGTAAASRAAATSGLNWRSRAAFTGFSPHIAGHLPSLAARYTTYHLAAAYQMDGLPSWLPISPLQAAAAAGAIAGATESLLYVLHLKLCYGLPSWMPISPPQAALAGAIAGATESLLSTPFDLLRTRLLLATPLLPPVPPSHPISLPSPSIRIHRPSTPSQPTSSSLGKPSPSEISPNHTSSGQSATINQSSNPSQKAGVRAEGAAQLWRGLRAGVTRDSLFGAVFFGGWVTIEEGLRELEELQRRKSERDGEEEQERTEGGGVGGGDMGRGSVGNGYWYALTQGLEAAVAAAVASVVSHPFDCAKTRTQATVLPKALEKVVTQAQGLSGSASDLAHLLEVLRGAEDALAKHAPQLDTLLASLDPALHLSRLPVLPVSLWGKGGEGIWADGGGKRGRGKWGSEWVNWWERGRGERGETPCWWKKGSDLAHLLEVLRGAEDALAKHAPQLDTLLASLDPALHSLAFLFFLDAHAAQAPGALWEQVVGTIINFIKVASPTQLALAPEKFATLCHRLRDQLISHSQYARGVLPLRWAISKVQQCTTAEHLTPQHADCLQLCLLAKLYRQGGDLLQGDILDIDPKKTGLVHRDFLLYCFYGGTIYVEKRVPPSLLSTSPLLPSLNLPSPPFFQPPLSSLLSTSPLLPSFNLPSPPFFQPPLSSLLSTSPLLPSFNLPSPPVFQPPLSSLLSTSPLLPSFNLPSPPFFQPPLSSLLSTSPLLPSFNLPSPPFFQPPLSSFFQPPLSSLLSTSPLLPSFNLPSPPFFQPPLSSLLSTSLSSLLSTSPLLPSFNLPSPPFFQPPLSSLLSTSPLLPSFNLPSPPFFEPPLSSLL
ncbi:unnamed protein product [Closterium sp. NIES-64]|nr:unnamed protein product [Closterium sp. NIES-64]